MTASQSSLADTDDVDWSEVYVSALLVARTLVRAQEVDDVVNEGMTRVLDGRAPWDASTGHPLASHVAHVGANALRAASKKVTRRASGAFVSAMSAEIENAAPPDAEETLAQIESKTRFFEQIVAAFTGDADALAIVGCEERQIDRPLEQAAATGLDIETVRNVRKRLRRWIQALAEGGAR